MALTLRRVILFTRRMNEMTAFYHDVLGLTLVNDEATWKEFDAGGTRIALHEGQPEPGRTKLAFFTDAVEGTREELIGRGASMKGIMAGDGLVLCDGKDPDGNPFQLSNRR